MVGKILGCLIAVSIISTFGISQRPSQSNPSPLAAPTQVINDDEYRIYEVLYDRWFGKDKLKMLVIDPDLKTCSKVTFYADPQYSKVPETKTDEIESNCKTIPQATLTKEKFRVDQKIVFVTREEQEKYFPDGIDCEVGWKNYFKKYPSSNGYMSVSRAGFDSDRHFAAVYFSYIRACLDGEGQRVFLENEGGRWKIIYNVMTWAN